jgi:hypothetical protein
MLDMGFIPDIERICKPGAVHPADSVLLGDHAAGNHANLTDRSSCIIRPESTVSRAATTGREHRRKSPRGRRMAAATSARPCARLSDREARTPSRTRSSSATASATSPSCTSSLEKSTGSTVGALHGDMDQRARMASLDAFRRNGGVSILVCSDVAARGLDIPTSATCSISTCPSTHSKITFIASAAPAGRGLPARRIRS